MNPAHLRWQLNCLIVIFFTPLLITVSCSGSKSRIKPEEQDIVESVYASAMVKSADQYVVYSPVSGLLQANLVKEGDTVLAGQTIAQIENTNPGLNAENARLALELAQRNMGNLDELQSQISTAERQYTLDSVNYDRQAELWRQNIGTKAQLESRQLALAASKNNLQSLRTRYRQTRIQLQLAKEQAENAYAMTTKSSNDFSITSKINGRVYMLNYKVGELVVPQQPVALIGRAGQFMMELTVDEVDITRVFGGQKIVISMDAYPGKVFEGIVSRILPNMDVRSQTFKVEAEFVDVPPSLYPGLSAEVNIVINKKSHALVIPLEYLKSNDTVVTKEGEKKVKIGLRSLDKVEILEGIDKNTELIKPQ